MKENKLFKVTLLTCYSIIAFALIKSFIQLTNNPLNKSELKGTYSTNIDTLDNWVNVTNTISNDLPYSIWNRKNDSLKLIEDERKGKKDLELIGGSSIDWFGLYQYKNKKADNDWFKSISNRINELSLTVTTIKKDSLELKRILDSMDESNKINSSLDLDIISPKIEKGADVLNFLTLKNYQIKKEGTFFYVKDNKWYLAIPSYTKKGESHYLKEYASKQVDIRYIINSSNPYDCGDLQIPITNNTAIFLSLIRSIIIVSSILLMLFFTFFGPITLIKNISRGYAFIPYNIKLFYFSSLAVVLFPTINILLQYLTFWYFKHIIPSDLIFFPKHDGLFICLIYSALLYVIGLALKKGASLQQDSDLTI